MDHAGELAAVHIYRGPAGGVRRRQRARRPSPARWRPWRPGGGPSEGVRCGC
ncbi:MAG: hypothetical protein WDM92_05365 [Caulobacteraceae bacterium]